MKRRQVSSLKKITQEDRKFGRSNIFYVKSFRSSALPVSSEMLPSFFLGRHHALSADNGLAKRAPEAPDDKQGHE
jgi:hypothetical protein